MKMKCFTIYDDKAKAYLPPFFLPETAMALRAFGDGVTDANSQFGKHPEDYTMFMVGTFDVQSGQMIAEPALLMVATAVEVRAMARRVAEQMALDMQRQQVAQGEKV